MKNNRKNRNLNFIRTKNNLRTGKVKFYCSEKISNETKEDEHYFDNLLNTARKSLHENYKLVLPVSQVLPFKIIEDDASNNVHTNCVVLSLK